MTRTAMTWTALTRWIGTAAAVAATAAALSGCTGGPAGAASPGAPSSGTTSGTASPAPASATPGATASAWKVFTDPAKGVSFELPQEWIAQSVPPDPGSLAGALKIEVKDAAGGYLATLRTGIPPQTVPTCPDGAAKPYVVVSSVPVELPHREGDGLIAPHVVFRVIQGYKFFGSYGITNMAGGAGGRSCGLQNVVRGPEGKGDYSFGDLPVLNVLAPDQKVAPAKSFDTLDQAATYVSGGSEFANVQRMLMSLKVKD